MNSIVQCSRLPNLFIGYLEAKTNTEFGWDNNEQLAYSKDESVRLGFCFMPSPGVACVPQLHITITHPPTERGAMAADQVRQIIQELNSEDIMFT